MAEDAKRFYWLKLKKDFFKRHDVRIIKNMPNGKDYIIFYLELLCESLDHDGELRFSKSIPYNEDMLATITDTNVDIVRSAIKLFQELNLVEIWDDGTYFMTKVREMTDSRVDNDGANRVRRLRERRKAELLQERYTNVTKCNESIEYRDKSNNISFTNVQDILSESDDSSNDLSKKESIPYQQIVDKYNEVCGDVLPKCTAISDKRRKAMAACWKAYKEKVFDALQMVSESEFLTGKDNKWTNCNFDWIFNTNNMLKILEGVYKNKKTNPNHYSADPMVGTPLSEEEFRKANSFLFEGKGE